MDFFEVIGVSLYISCTLLRSLQEDLNSALVYLIVIYWLKQINHLPTQLF